jgi:hypothetical protein
VTALAAVGLHPLLQLHQRQLPQQPLQQLHLSLLSSCRYVQLTLLRFAAPAQWLSIFCHVSICWLHAGEDLAVMQGRCCWQQQLFHRVLATVWWPVHALLHSLTACSGW